MTGLDTSNIKEFLWLPKYFMENRKIEPNTEFYVRQCAESNGDVFD
jgi:hypothetical protein